MHLKLYIMHILKVIIFLKTNCSRAAFLQHCRGTEKGKQLISIQILEASGAFCELLTCSCVTGMSLCLESSLMTLRSVLMSNLQPTSTTLALGQNSCVSPCHCASERQTYISVHDLYYATVREYSEYLSTMFIVASHLKTLDINVLLICSSGKPFIRF